MLDFDEQSIDIRYFTNLWGPYSFAFPPCSSATANDGVIPYGTTIQTVSVKAYIGNVTPSATLASETDITATLIDPAYTPVVSADTNVLVKFQHPGVAYKGEKATLIFELTLDTNAKHPFYFKYLRIR